MIKTLRLVTQALLKWSTKFNDGGHYSNLQKDTKGTQSFNRSKESRNVSQAGAVYHSVNIWK